MKMSICASAFESDACMQVFSAAFSNKSLSSLFSLSFYFHTFSRTRLLVIRLPKMLPELWMAPLLASPLLDSPVLAEKSTEMCAKAAGKASTSSSGRGSFGIFDHSNSLIGTESDVARTCSHCAHTVAFQQRCIVVDQVRHLNRVVSFFPCSFILEGCPRLDVIFQTKAALFQKPQ